MEQPTLNSRRRGDEAAEFNLRESNIMARMISRENSKSRRFSSSYIRSFREDHSRTSFKSNITISSTASSPGYNLKEEIDPSTYSFSSALRALQARSVNTWDCVSPDGFALNSKWYEAEKYICNPLSGEVPLECLSAKTLSGRSFHNLKNRMTMSAPLMYPNSRSRFTQTRPCFSPYNNQDLEIHNSPIREKKVGNMTRNMGVQSTPPDRSPSCATPASSPRTEERSTKLNSAGGDSVPFSTPKLTTEEEEGKVKQASSDGKEETQLREEEEEAAAAMRRKEKQRNLWKCNREAAGCGCLSLRSLWRRKLRHNQKDKHKSRHKINICPLPC